jgi:hypothetical protein
MAAEAADTRDGLMPFPCAAQRLGHPKPHVARIEEIEAIRDRLTERLR